MNRKGRVACVNKAIVDLERLRSELESLTDQEQSNAIKVQSRREQLKCIEAKLSAIRLVQSESRLIQQITLGLGGMVSGSLVTLLARNVFG